MTLKQTLSQAKKKLRYTCERPLFEAEILLAHHLGKDRPYLMLHEQEEVLGLPAFERLLARRVAHEPMEYITGRVSFYDMELFVAPGALIPRPETEILVEKCAALIRKHGITQIAEIGVGSGAISIALARLFPGLGIIASDISADALAVARHNVEAFGLQEQISLRHTSLLEGIEEPIEMIVSNPPYIARDTPLAPNVAEYEPHTALYSETQGDELIKEIILLAQERKVHFLACEMGYDQRESLSTFVQELGSCSLSFYRDYAGLDRGFEMQFY